MTDPARPEPQASIVEREAFRQAEAARSGAGRLRRLAAGVGDALTWGCGPTILFGVAAVGALALLAQLRTLEAVVLAFGVGVPLLVALAWTLLAQAGRHLLARAAGLRDLSPMRGPIGVLFLVRGRTAEGRGVRVFAGRVEVDLDGPPPLAIEYGRDVLAALAREADAGADRAGAAARDLLRLGARRVVVGERTVTVHGWTSTPAAELAGPALALALAPARVRFKARATDGSTCPYCRGGFERVRADPAVRCAACDVRHHAGCWKEHGGCAVYRCRRAPAEGHARPVRVEGLGQVVAPEIGRSEERARDDAPEATGPRDREVERAP